MNVPYTTYTYTYTTITVSQQTQTATRQLNGTPHKPRKTTVNANSY